MSLEECKVALQNSGLCILPTETVYGLACSALCPNAIKKVFFLKGRPINNPLIVHVLDHDSAKEICVTNTRSKILTEKFWPGALTLILPKKKCIPTEITAGLNSVAVRSPSHPIFREILEMVKLPLAAPSANPSNKLSPTSLQDVIDAFGAKCPPMIDGGQCEFGIESTVLDLTVQTPSILRFGPITKEQIEEVLEMEINSNSSSPHKKLNQSQKSPGQGSLHYAPETPLYLHSNHMKMLKSEIIDKENIIIIPKDLIPQKEIVNNKRLIFLPASNNSLKTAKVLYATLRKADKLMGEKIHIALYPSTSQLFTAINDRLTRASTERV